MALISTVTDYGSAQNAASLGPGGTPGDIVRIELGTGHVTTPALARARQAGVVTPFAPRRESQNPPVFVAGPTAQTTFFDAMAGQYTYNELAAYDAGGCIYYECDDAGAAIGSKGEDALQKSIAFTYSNGDASLVAREYVIMPLATTDNVGLVKYATDAEVAGDDFVVLRPAQIRTLVAGVQAGLTASEVNQLISNWISANRRFATSAEARAGTMTGVVMSPLLSRTGMLAYKLPSAPSAYDTLATVGAAIRDWANQDGFTTISQTDFDARTVRVPGRLFLIPE